MRLLALKIHFSIPRSAGWVAVAGERSPTGIGRGEKVPEHMFTPGRNWSQLGGGVVGRRDIPKRSPNLAVVLPGRPYGCPGSGPLNPIRWPVTIQLGGGVPFGVPVLCGGPARLTLRVPEAR
jgi:hypothetical protein